MPATSQTSTSVGAARPRQTESNDVIGLVNNSFDDDDVDERFTRIAHEPRLKKRRARFDLYLQRKLKIGYSRRARAYGVLAKRRVSSAQPMARNRAKCSLVLSAGGKRGAPVAEQGHPQRGGGRFLLANEMTKYPIGAVLLILAGYGLVEAWPLAGGSYTLHYFSHK